MLHIDVLGAVLALGILCQHDTGLIIAIQGHVVDGLGYYLEFVKEASQPDGFSCCMPQGYVLGFRRRGGHFSLLLAALGYDRSIEKVTIAHHGLSILGVSDVAAVSVSDEAEWGRCGRHFALKK